MKAQKAKKSEKAVVTAKKKVDFISKSCDYAKGETDHPEVEITRVPVFSKKAKGKASLAMVQLMVILFNRVDKKDYLNFLHNGKVIKSASVTPMEIETEFRNCGFDVLNLYGKKYCDSPVHQRSYALSKKITNDIKEVDGKQVDNYAEGCYQLFYRDSSMSILKDTHQYHANPSYGKVYKKLLGTLSEQDIPTLCRIILSCNVRCSEHFGLEG